MELLIYLAMIVLLGALSSALAFQLKTSNAFFLLLTGMIFGAFGLIQFSEETIVTISIIALIIILSEYSRNFSFRALSSQALGVKFVLGNFFLSLVVVSLATYLLFDVPFFLAVAFAALVYGIDPAISSIGFPKNKLMKTESILNPTLAVLLPILILQGLYYQSTFLAFLQQMVIGVIIGIVMGFIIVSVMKSSMGDLSYLAVISAAVITYSGAELLRGNPVLAVLCFGLVFGNYHVQHRQDVDKFSPMFIHVLSILVFIMVGAMLFIPREYTVKGTFLFLIYLCLRYLSLVLFFKRTALRERLFLTLNVPKGIGAAVVILFMANVFKADSVVNLGLLFVLYSIVLSTVTTTFGTNLLGIKNS